MEISIYGHSGCEINIFSRATNYFVRKGTKDALYTHRLKKQAEKQKHFYAQNTLPSIATPAILHENETSGHFSFDMNYVNADDFINFLSKASKSSIDKVASTLIEFIEKNISASSAQEVDILILSRKVRSVLDNIEQNHSLHPENFSLIIERVTEILSQHNSVLIPIGFDHGDLTFSNMLFGNEKLYLIDFLDSFLESPLNDIVKLRQDTFHRWSFLMYTKSFDKTKLNIILNYLDNLIDEHFQSHAFYREYYHLLQIINFLRILQYAHDKKVIAYLEAELNNLIKVGYV